MRFIYSLSGRYPDSSRTYTWYRAKYTLQTFFPLIARVAHLLWVHKLELTALSIVRLPSLTSATSRYPLLLWCTVVAIQGILLVKHQSVRAPDGMVRLWMHEMSRVFGDRLAESNHRVMFEHMLIEAVGRSVP